MTRAGMKPIVLLDEGVFHQFHGGVATNVPVGQHPMEAFRAEHTKIVGQHFKPESTPLVVYFGKMPSAARRFIHRG